MSLYLETSVSLNEEEQKTVDDVFSNEFPWFFSYAKQSTNEFGIFCHVLMNRNNEVANAPGVVNSYKYEDFKNIFLKVCKANGIEVNVILRAAINRTFHIAEKFGHIHQDHKFPHKQFIWYLNDFTDAPTYIFDENMCLVKTTCVGKNKAVIFDNQFHAQGVCAPGETRIAVVFTFN